MYSIVLATVLTTGQAAPAADIWEEIQDIKVSLRQLQQEQKEARIEELKLVIAGLRQRITDEKLDEIRRDVRLLQLEELVPGAAVPLPMPVPATAAVPSTTRATIAVRIPAGATFVVNDKTIAVPAVNPTFVTPILQPGQDYFYDCKVTVVEDGKPVTRVKRVKVRAGEVVRIDYDSMDVR